MPNGPFLSLAPGAIPGGYDAPPAGGVCFSSFLFVRRADGHLLVGKSADHPKWAELIGLDAERMKRASAAWTVPASHVKLGEHPRAAAERVARDILGIAAHVGDRVTIDVDRYELARLPGQQHVDYWFQYDASYDGELPRPPWYAELAWIDPRATPATAYARGHEDVVASWLRGRAR